MIENSAHGIEVYAVKDRSGTILTDTLFGTERGAKVNWLFKHAKVAVLSLWTDETISAAFDIAARDAGAKLIACQLWELDRT